MHRAVVAKDPGHVLCFFFLICVCDYVYIPGYGAKSLYIFFKGVLNEKNLLTLLYMCMYIRFLYFVCIRYLLIFSIGFSIIFTAINLLYAPPLHGVFPSVSCHICFNVSFTYLVLFTPFVNTILGSVYSACSTIVGRCLLASS
jgi:hypothetical protein